jgi:VWFA-related protein
MKLSLLIAFLITFVCYCPGQTPIQMPSPEKTKTFGSSLEKYQNSEKKESNSNRRSNESEAEEVIQVKTDLVVNDFLVTDQKGNIITGLTREDFIVREDGAPQTIEMFSFGENASAPRSIVLILDTGITQLPYHKNSIQAAKVLIDKLGPSDKMAIVSDDLKLLTDFTQDKPLLKKALDSIEVKYSKLTNGREFTNLLAVLNEMFTDDDHQRIIISQGTGNGIFNIKTDDETLFNEVKSRLESRGVPKNPEKEIEFTDITEAIEVSGATIYSIIPAIRVLGLSKTEQFQRAGISAANHLQAISKLKRDFRTSGRLPYDLQQLEAKRLIKTQTSMFQVADLSGGNTHFLEKPEDAENIYSNIFNDFSHRYLIGYYPTNEGQNGKRRTIKIEVRNHAEYHVTGRKTYLPLIN